MQANSSFCFYFLFFINPVEVWGSPLSFQSRGLPNEIRVFWCPLPLRFGGGLACLGAGMLNTLKIILSWLQSRESEAPRAPSPHRGEEACGGTGIWGVGVKGVRVCTCGAVQRAGTPGTFAGRPSQAGRWRDLWRSRCLYFGRFVTRC